MKCKCIKYCYLHILNQSGALSVGIHLVVAEKVQTTRVYSLPQNMFCQAFGHHVPYKSLILHRCSITNIKFTLTLQQRHATVEETEPGAGGGHVSRHGRHGLAHVDVEGALQQVAVHLDLVLAAVLRNLDPLVQELDPHVVRLRGGWARHQLHVLGGCQRVTLQVGLFKNICNPLENS